MFYILRIISGVFSSPFNFSIELNKLWTLPNNEFGLVKVDIWICTITLLVLKIIIIKKMEWSALLIATLHLKVALYLILYHSIPMQNR